MISVNLNDDVPSNIIINLITESYNTVIQTNKKVVKNNNYLSVCAIIKDENAYLKEWIEYHILVGVDHFVLFDNGSKIPILNTVRELGYDLCIDVVDWSCPIINDGLSKQTAAYSACVEYYKHRSNWIAFIDIDEFLVIKNGSINLKQLLMSFEKFGGLAINWLVFGSSNLKNKPESQINSFIRRSALDEEINQHIKSIVQPKYVKSAGYDPHHFIYEDGYFAVDTNLRRVDGALSNPNYNHLVINHYYHRSESEFIEKCERGRGDGIGSRSIDEFYNNDEKFNNVIDRSIQNLVSRINDIPFIIFQIYYDSETMEHLDMGFIPYSNVGNKSPYYENDVILDLYYRQVYKNFRYCGVVSWKFSQKTRLSSSDIYDQVSSHDSDIIIISPPEFDRLGNPYTEKGFAEVCEIIKIIDDSEILPFKLLNYDGWITCWCNYWIAKPPIYEQYIKDILLPVKNFIEKETNGKLKGMLGRDIDYIGRKESPHTFICEGLMGAFIYHYNISHSSIKNHNFSQLINI